jgi:preprotein translocase subunit SecE
MYMAESANLSKGALFRKKIVRFFKEIRAELKKVIWPTKQQLINNTAAVLVVCAIIGAIIWILDFGLGRLVQATLAR